MLKIGAYLNFIIAAGHIAALFFLDAAFRYYGIDGLYHVDVKNALKHLEAMLGGVQHAQNEHVQSALKVHA